MKKIFLILSIVFLFNACSSVDNTLTQVSTIDALLAGYYDGVMPLDKLTKYGNFGLGTFDKLDGEMIVYNGIVYQFKTDGKLYKADLSGTTPFASVVNFNNSFTTSMKSGVSFADFQSVIDNALPNKNLFYAIKVTGDFSFMKTRSVPPQEKPYKSLSEVTKTQAVFEKENQSGTLVGFRLPEFTKGVNVPGYHVHFITSDFTFGGHVLDFSTGNVTVEVQEINNFYMILPKDSEFGKVDLSKDRSKELKKVEN